MHACKDYSGAEIMRTVRDEVVNLKIPVVEFTAAVELIKDEKGQVAGAVLQNMETGDYLVARAKTVVIATGMKRDVCIIKDSRLLTIMEQQQTDL